MYKPNEALLTPAEARQMTRVLAELAQHSSALNLERLFYFTGGSSGNGAGLMPLYDPNATASPSGTLPLTAAGRVLQNVAHTPLPFLSPPSSPPVRPVPVR